MSSLSFLLRSVSAAWILFVLSVSAFGDEPAPPREWIRINGTRLRVPVARTLEEQRQGLMNRKTLKDGDGMLFAYTRETPLIFWMKNTLIPLDIGFFGSDGVLMAIRTMEVDAEGTDDRLRTRYESPRPGMYALEVPKGWFAKKGIRPGAKIVLEGAKSPTKKTKPKPKPKRTR